MDGKSVPLIELEETKELISPSVPPEERIAAFEQVMSSQCFSRARSLRSILEVICTRSFQGETYTSEYHIALEALNRDVTFNPAEDAAVRVQVHNLRKRLKEYYEGEGKSSAVRIVIPVGSYFPEFARSPHPVGAPTASSSKSAEVLSPQPMVLETSEETLPANGTRLRGKIPAEWTTNRSLLLRFSIGFIVAAVILYGAISLPRPGGAPFPRVEATDAGVIRIAPGTATPFPDSSGRIWDADRWSRGGESYSHRTHTILRSYEQRLYQEGKMGDFDYDIPIPNRNYELRLYFADTWGHKELEGTFSLSMNGGPVQKIDVVCLAGGADTAVAKAFLGIRPAHDGKLHLSFKTDSGPAFLNAIELIPSPDNRMQPIRITTLTSPVFDSKGAIWLPDEWFLGGRIAQRANPVENTSNPQLYTSERYGRFSYSIPVVPGHTYKLRLYFSEVWYRLLPNAHPGTRVFTVSGDGHTLLENFDILAETRMKNMPLVKSFDHIRPNSQGEINLTFDPSVDYAIINAIEVEDEGTH